MTCDVLIIGAGPVGMTMACELARYGVSVRIVEKNAERTDKSKALVLWSRTLELLDRGIYSKRFRDAGSQVHAANIIGRSGALLTHVAMDTVDSPYAYGLMLPQSETEQFLEERLSELGVTIERNTEAMTISQRDDGVDVSIRNLDGTEEVVSAGWLVGCDGAHSVARHAIGAEFTGDTRLSDFVLGDVHMDGYPFPNTELALYWHEDGLLAIFPISGQRYRVIADLPMTDGPKPPDPTLAQIQEILEERGPGGMKVYDPIWLSGFRINERKVSSYRSGRVFLAGDAAHIHSPAGGQGMNTGMQDAFNLAWKLALVIQGACDPDLLDSFSSERSLVGEQVLKNAERLTTVATIKNASTQKIRDFVGRFVFGLSAVRNKMAETMTEVSIGYPHSPLNFVESTVRSGLRNGERVAPVAGQEPFGSGPSPKFVLFADAAERLVALASRFANVLDENIRPALEAGDYVLVRPDGYVACRTTEERDIESYLTQLTARRAD